MNKEKVCYICCFWLGDRRSTTQSYDEDRFSYVKGQIESLQNCLHNINTIFFVFNLEKDHEELFEQAKLLIPTHIQNAEVKIVKRDNIGLSYGAWSDVFGQHRFDYDYYIFNEDDYFFVQDNFDSYLINKFNSKVNTGYLCMLAINPTFGNPEDVVHAGNSVGISSSKVLNELWDKFGLLPHYRDKVNDLKDRYFLSERNGQMNQTHEIYKLGYNILDIRDDFRVTHDIGTSRKNEAPDFNNFVEIYFYWQKNELAIPAILYFKEPFYYIEMKDEQFESKKTCYIVNLYFGPRRRVIEDYNNDKLCYLKKQIETLSQYYHNLDKIVFNINFSSDHLEYVNTALSLIPKKIQNTSVEVFLRENKGLSYGAFSDNFARLRNEYDFFIFNEDDYFLVENNWDEYLVRKYRSLPNSGYLCAMQRDEDAWNDYKIHAGHCFGIASTKALNSVWEKYGCLPHSNDTNDYVAQEKIQREFGYAFVDVGLRVYDIRDEYRVAFARTEEDTEDIWRWFWWNEKDLIIPAIMAFNKSHTWWESYEESFMRKTNLEKYNLNHDI